MAQAVTLRRVADADAQALADLHRPLFHPPWTALDFARLLAVETTVGQVATTTDGARDRLIGMVLAQVVLDEAEILTVAVIAEHQGTGVGGALLRRLDAMLAARGVAGVHLEVAVGNGSARALYARAGYGPTGRRDGYYSASAAGAAIVMTKWLDRPQSAPET